MGEPNVGSGSLGDLLAANRPKPEEKAFLEEADLGKVAKLQVYGKEVEVPLSEVLKNYQKGVAADEKFREAHAEKEMAESALMVVEDLKKGLAEQDPTRLRRAFRNAGWPEDAIEAVFQTDGGTAGDSTLRPPSPAVGNPKAAVPDETTDDESGELEEKIRGLEAQLTALVQREQKAEETKKQLRTKAQVDSAIDADADIAKMLATLDSEDRNTVRRVVYGFVAEASESLPWGPRAIAKGIENAKARPLLKKMMEAAAAGGTSTAGGRTAGAGFGPAGTTVGAFHQGTSNEKPVSIKDPKYPGFLMRKLSRVLGQE